jgi:hypothetical protein
MDLLFKFCLFLRMKLKILTPIFCIVYNIANAQMTDTSTIKQITLNGFSLCYSTIANIKSQYPDLKEVTIEEMDISKNCIGQDSRFIASMGYQTDKQIGIILQKDQSSDYVSKIRLTKQFVGKLPDGVFINMNNLILKDLFKLYPHLKSKWGSRGCSDYWNFSNDTISFYVKILPRKIGRSH